MSRFKIIINRSNVQGVNNNFIYLFSQDASNIPSDFWDNVSDANGLDIHFYAMSTGKKLSREIVHFDSAAQEIEAWIQIPPISSQHNTEILCEYGETVLSNDTELWSDLGIKACYHMTAIGSTGDILVDSTTNHNVIKLGAVLQTTGEIYKAQQFSVNNDAATGDHDDFDLMPNSAITFWCNPDLTGTQGYIAAKGSSGITGGWGVDWRGDNDQIDFYHGGSTSESSSAIFTDTDWVYVAIKITGDGGQERVNFWRNGITAGSANINDQVTNTNSFTLGNNYNGTGESTYFDGGIDEIRVYANYDLEVDRIVTEYNNQSDPATFSLCESFTNKRIARKFKITIDKGQTQGTNSNFIYLFSQDTSNIPDSLWLNVFDSDGLDIHFYDAITGLKLKREIVHFDATNQEIEAWIQIPTVSSTSDTEIWCKYGETVLSNDTELWSDLGIKACYHMTAIGSTGDILVDSTTNHNVIKLGAVLQTTGEIYKAQQFSVNNDAATGDHDDFDLMPESAITFWCKPDLTGTQGYVASKGGYSTSNGWGVNWRGDENRIDFYHGGESLNSSSTVFTDTDWVYVAIKVKQNGNQNVKFYRNGVAAGGTDIDNMVVNTVPFIIGNRNNGTTESHYFDGGIDEIRVYANYDLEVDRMVTEYNNQSDPATFSSCSEDSFDRGEEKTIALISG